MDKGRGNLQKVVDRQAIALSAIHGITMRIAEASGKVDPDIEAIWQLSKPQATYRGRWCENCAAITTHKGEKCGTCGL